MYTERAGYVDNAEAYAVWERMGGAGVGRGVTDAMYRRRYSFYYYKNARDCNIKYIVSTTWMQF